MPSRLIIGDALTELRRLPAESVHCCVTSPPYWGLRSYLPATSPLKALEMGCERTPEEYVDRLVEVFREVGRVLRSDGTLWLVIADSYTSGGRKSYGPALPWHKQASHTAIEAVVRRNLPSKLKPKELIGIPWRVAFALQADGWYLRSDIIYAKTNPMPESVTDRPTRSHEYVFLFAKSGRPRFWTHRDRPGSRGCPQPDYVWRRATDEVEVETEPPEWHPARLPDGLRLWRRVNLWRGHDYYYDADAIREPHIYGDHHRNRNARSYAPPSEQPPHTGLYRAKGGARHRQPPEPGHEGAFHPLGRNKRSVWTVRTEPFPGPHFATFPEALIEPMVLASTSPHVCPSCGAPYSRIVELGEADEAWREACGADSGGGYAGRATKDYAGAQAENPSAVKARILAGMRERVTTEWRPTCPCPQGAGPGRSVVADPFVGSGTTLAVAERLGRDSIGIDLDPRSRAMCQKRLEKLDQPLWPSLSHL